MKLNPNISISKIALPAETKSDGGVGDVSLLDQPKYTIPKAAKRVGMGETNFRAVVNKGLIPVFKPPMSKKVIILESDLDAFFKTYYGRIKKEEMLSPSSKLPALPDFITNSKYLNRRRN